MNEHTEEGKIIYDSLSVGNLFQTFQETIFGGIWNTFSHTIEKWWLIYSIIAMFLSLLFFVGYVYAKTRHAQLSAMEQEALNDAEKAWASKYIHTHSRNVRWDTIQTRVSENNPESWRVAIIEADILLDETLTNAGYVGQSLGEKLKSANAVSFTTIQDAWEAHKVRNEIAHTGSDFVLTQKNARETLTRFERVFREFGVI